MIFHLIILREWRAKEGESPVFGGGVEILKGFKSQAVWECSLKWEISSSKAKYYWDSDSKQVLRRKDVKYFEKRVNRLELVEIRN